MALYQAAVSKQEALPTSVSVSAPVTTDLDTTLRMSFSYFKAQSHFYPLPLPLVWKG